MHNSLIFTNLHVKKGKLLCSENPNDPDAEYRQKGDQKVKGYSVNVTETTDQERSPATRPTIIRMMYINYPFRCWPA